MEIFDSHAHYDDPRFDDDRDVLLGGMAQNGVKRIVNIGCNEETSRAAAALAQRYPFVWATAGWHPEFAGDWNESARQTLLQLAANPRVRAIGEIGLDYHYMDAAKETQLAAFSQQMAVAQQLSLPVVIHEREAVADCLSVIRQYTPPRGVFHCYSGSYETATELLDRGYYLGFTGVITFKNARKSHEVLRNMPAERILVETDCPYLTPVPHRGERNDSRMLRYTLATLAELRNLSIEEAAALTFRNAQRFYHIE